MLPFPHTVQINLGVLHYNASEALLCFMMLSYIDQSVKQSVTRCRASKRTVCRLLYYDAFVSLKLSAYCFSEEMCSNKWFLWLARVV